MKELFFVIILSLLSGTYAFAQWGYDELSEEATTRERLFVGGGLGAAFSSYYTNVSVSPLIGYNITSKFAGGIQVSYRYTNYKGRPSISISDYSISPFVRYRVYAPFFLHVEYEYLNYYDPQDAIRKYYNSVMGGVGYFQTFAPRGGFYLMALYNLSFQSTSYTDYSPYDSPLLFRAGVTFGL